MDSIRLKNFRSIKDSGKIDLKPLTLLVGKNGSGKSSFLRYFPLLRQSAETKKQGAFFWTSPYVDFGGFTQSLRQDSSLQEIHTEYWISSKELMLKSFESPTPVHVLLHIGLFPGDEVAYVKSIVLQIQKDSVSIEIGKNQFLEKFQVNDFDILKQVGEFSVWPFSQLLPTIGPKDFVEQGVTGRRKQGLFFLSREVDPTLRSVMREFLLSEGKDKEEVENQINDLRFKENGNLTFSSENEENFRSLFLASLTPSILGRIDDYLVELCAQVKYIGPVRATAKRSYPAEEYAVSEIDHLGRNVATFLKNLEESKRNDFQQWTLDHLDFEIWAERDGSQTILKLREEKKEVEFNLVDTGFGFSQILPIVLQLWLLTQLPLQSQAPPPQIYAMEQPELHLHPNHQAKIADMLVKVLAVAKSLNLDLRLLIETHSEAIINRLGNIVADGICDSDNISVLLFEKEPEALNTTLRKANYDKEGYLENWPFGFFIPEEKE